MYQRKHNPYTQNLENRTQSMQHSIFMGDSTDPNKENWKKCIQRENVSTKYYPRASLSKKTLCSLSVKAEVFFFLFFEDLKIVQKITM